ncbi:MAG: glycolate oxidase subunit GlcF [Rhodospirillaceae bacterium]|nr:glycolate oxidase subunit GlcF [Rhodospirillaceae bacterium]MBT5299911.1 glycolate oxidase subunit GlcF [Rhodospirillaceae bacterium]MBT5513073.1 glycolate oxidase subunit GlcF [Rhodospirillaceae bacterium]MBT6087483.1 glycolate oxidase subunit GlcF [Rhodospirillaceae bacterium]MBT7249911.1 glycolate oxidase subunit GlcF [Rhodospirillaceae bacterium]
MQTNFTLAQLADPDISAANDILRKCVHCGFCTATCPTYVLLGDELDSPRGRIYQIREMLESDQPAKPSLVTHVDRCLSCLSCMTTCPASVNYMHLVDHARARIEKTHTRPLAERLLRMVLAAVLPHPKIFRLSLIGAWFAKPFAGLLPGRLKGLVSMAPARIAGLSDVDRPQVFPAIGKRRMRVALMNGCAQQVLKPAINEATVRLLTRHGCEVIVSKGSGCCGALVHHMGREGAAHGAAKANIAAWEKLGVDEGGLDAVVINASGCGTTVKDYGFMLRDDADWAHRASWVSERTRDITEVMTTLGLGDRVIDEAPAVAYHSACSMQHGQQLTATPKDLLMAAGFEVREPREGHLCCGSAGTYNIMQPELANQLRERKLGNLKNTGADIVAAGNIGCMEQLTADGGPTVVHTVELLDWATGGPRPAGI